MIVELLLIRHAQSENNAKPESERVEDPGLTPIGRRQAARLADAFAAWDVEHLATSAFRRALLTADRLRRRTGHRLQVWRHLHEVGGCYAGHIPGLEEGRPGMNAQQLLAEFPGADFEEEIPPTGWWSSAPYESDTRARERAAQQARRLVERYRDSRRVACVVHADFKAMLLESLLGEGWEESGSVALANAGVTWLHCHPEQVTLQRLNDTGHLPPSLVTD